MVIKALIVTEIGVLHDMTKRRLLLSVLLVAAIVWLVRRIDFAALITRFEPIALPTALGFAIAGAVALLAGIVALTMARANSRKAAMANDDALRVIRMHQRKSANAEQAQVIINTPPLAPLEDEPTTTPKAQPAQQSPSLVVSSHKGKITVDDGIFFQPVICAPTGDVMGFGVFRRLSTGKARKSFAHYASHLSKSAQAKLEADGVMTATSEARRVLGRDKKGAPLWIDVPVSEALLADRVQLQSVLNLMSAHPTLKRSVRLLIDARALFKARKAVLDALKSVQREGVTMALNLAETGRTPVKPEMLSWFDALYVSKSDVQQAIMRQQAETSIAPGNKPPLPDSASLLGSLAEARRLKLPIIATNVVCEPDAVDMLAEDIELMTGPLFGEPRAIKAKLLTPPPARSAQALNKTG